MLAKSGPKRAEALIYKAPTLDTPLDIFAPP
jgi:hypothetical protein